jgi:hypothetical protein
MKKLLLIALMAMAMTITIAGGAQAGQSDVAVNANAIPNVVKNATIWNLQCFNDGAFLMGYAHGASKRMTIMFGSMNTGFLNNIGIKTDIGYETLFFHTNKFICSYLQNNAQTKARLMFLTFSHRIFNSNVNGSIFDQILIGAYIHNFPKSDKLSAELQENDKVLLKDLFIGNYRQAERIIKSVSLDNAEIYLMLPASRQ